MTLLRGKFIVLEGGEGTGKSTLLKTLQETFVQDGYEVVVTREPGGTLFAEELRRILLEGKQSEVEPEVLTQILLMEASRVEHIHKVILPVLTAGKIVLCDRFSLSTYAYQIGGEGKEDLARELDAIDKVARRIGHDEYLEPDMVLLLEGDVEKCLERMKRREGEMTRFDQKKLAFHKGVAEGYKRYRHIFRCEIIDANQSPAEVAAQALKILQKVLAA